VTNAPPKPRPKPEAIVPILKPAVATPPARRDSRSRMARSEDIWKRKLARRAAPVDAKELVPRLKAAFRAEGVPEQLVWLAEVESTMDPQARSPAGAVGLFQMMTPTAQRFGLKTSPVDERLDPVRQATAAAQYLRFLHGKFRSWPLALAAYNAGEGRIAKALKAQNGRTFDDIASVLSVETQMYVPKISAVLQLREGAQLDRLPAPRAKS
jgi:membrane-bound lytic murein transglycosylase D